MSGSVLLCALFASTPAAQAQLCGEWSAGFARPSLPSGGQSHTLASFDLGHGRELYAVRRVGATDAEVVHWTGARWDVSFSRSVTSAPIVDLYDVAIGGQTRLVFSIQTSSFALPNELWTFDGTAWTQFPSPFFVSELVSADDGTGAALYAVGGLDSGLPFSRQGFIARWDGTNWNQIGASFANFVTDLVAFDDGGGTRLYACGQNHPSFLTGATTAVWDGTNWNPVDATEYDTYDLAVFNGELYSAGFVTGGGTGFRKLVGGAWAGVGSPAFTPTEMVEVDFGAGPRLAFSGSAPLAGAGGAPIYDGATLSPLAGGLANPGNSQTGIASVVVVDDAGTERLYAAGSFTRAGNAPQIGCVGLASTNGSTWATIGRGFDGAVSVLARHDAPGAEQLFAAGTFVRAGYATSVSGGARWDGVNWLQAGLGAPDAFFALRSIDLGSGAQLYAGGRELFGDTTRGVVRWNGASWVAFSNPIGGDVHALGSFDDGSGTKLVAGGNFTGGPSGTRIAQLTGSTWSPLGAGMNNVVASLETYDEGAGARLFAGGAFTTADAITTGGIARWDGSAWSAVGAGITGGVNALCVFAGELWVGGTFTSAGGGPLAYLARWNGTTWSAVPGGGPDGGVFALCVHDDGRGPALYAGGSFASIGGITAYNLARCDGVSWEAVDGGLSSVVNALASVDDDADGDRELFVGGLFTDTATVASGSIARLEGCPHYASFCFGDGSFTDHTTPCPCGNNGAPGNGCAHSFDAGGANLSATGSTFTDTVVLRSQFEPVSSFTLFLQQANQGDAVFHDGVLCAANPLVRLRGRGAVGGEAFFPNSAFAQDTTTSLSLRGGVTTGSGVTRYYSAFYRNASTTFCPPATANVTNGVRVVW